MQVNGKAQRTIWENNETKAIEIIDQRWLPHKYVVETIESVNEMVAAIRDMHLRGAPCIGGAAAYGMYLACKEAKESENPTAYLKEAADKLNASRPTAVNLSWAINEQQKAIEDFINADERIQKSLETARQIVDGSVDRCRRIGEHGLELIEKIADNKKGETINILTHCNAGWLACIDYGTATAPIYAAHNAGIPVHVWVDETRPRNQGARLTAWELLQEGVPHTVIADNTGGHLMQHGLVDLVIVGSDRTTRCGDVANKIGTYLKALAAKDNDVPFYVALPSTTIDLDLENGADIPIEQRSGEEVTRIQGSVDGDIKEVLLTPKNSPAANYAFDVTPARLVTGLITEFGVCAASEEGIKGIGIVD